MRSVLVANRKGGCGKTTIAITLAAAIAEGGWKVALADTDPQKSATRWLKMRPGQAAKIKRLDWSTAKTLGTAPKGLDFIIIDAPGSIYEEAEALVAEADVILTPVLPSFFDADSSRRFVKDLQHIKRVRKGKVGVHLIANRIRHGHKPKMRLQGFFDRVGAQPIATLKERVAYENLAEEGLTIFDCAPKRFAALREDWSPLLKAVL